MFPYILRRVLWTIPVIVVATLLAFSLVKAMPSEPFNNPRLPENVRENLRELYGLDQPFLVQYGDFLGDLVQGDLGVSTKPGAEEITTIIGDKLPTTMLLGLLAFALSASVGLTLGVLSALFSNGPVDYGITVLSTLAFAFPSFVVATVWVQYTEFYGWDTWSERIGPISVLALAIMPYFVRLVRASMLEALQQDYVTTARAKGLPWRTTVVRHMLRNSLIPTVTNAGPLFGFVLTGSFVIERIMIVPGVADQFVESFTDPIDSRMVLGTTVLLSLLIIALNLIVDIVVAWLDPRISHD